MKFISGHIPIKEVPLLDPDVDPPPPPPATSLPPATCRSAATPLMTYPLQPNLQSWQLRRRLPVHDKSTCLNLFPTSLITSEIQSSLSSHFWICSLRHSDSRNGYFDVLHILPRYPLDSGTIFHWLLNHCNQYYPILVCSQAHFVDTSTLVVEHANTLQWELWVSLWTFC